MMLRLQKYDLTVTYKKGSEMYLDDTLSKVCRQPSKEQDRRGDAEKYFVVVIFWCCIGGLFILILIRQCGNKEMKRTSRSS